MKRLSLIIVLLLASLALAAPVSDTDGRAAHSSPDAIGDNLDLTRFAVHPLLVYRLTKDEPAGINFGGLIADDQGRRVLITAGEPFGDARDTLNGLPCVSIEAHDLDTWELVAHVPSKHQGAGHVLSQLGGQEGTDTPCGQIIAALGPDNLLMLTHGGDRAWSSQCDAITGELTRPRFDLPGQAKGNRSGYFIANAAEAYAPLNTGAHKATGNYEMRWFGSCWLDGAGCWTIAGDSSQTYFRFLQRGAADPFEKPVWNKVALSAIPGVRFACYGFELYGVPRPIAARPGGGLWVWGWRAAEQKYKLFGVGRVGAKAVIDTEVATTHAVYDSSDYNYIAQMAVRGDRVAVFEPLNIYQRPPYLASFKGGKLVGEKSWAKGDFSLPLYTSLWSDYTGQATRMMIAADRAYIVEPRVDSLRVWTINLDTLATTVKTLTLPLGPTSTVKLTSLLADRGQLIAVGTADSSRQFVAVMSDGGMIASPPQPPIVITPPTAAWSVTIPAGQFVANVGASGYAWTPTASGGGGMTTFNKGNYILADVAATSPRLEYSVTVPSAGSYAVSITGVGATTSDDSCWVSVDGALPAMVDGFTKTAAARPAGTFQLAAGEHRINCYMREDGFVAQGVGIGGAR